MANKIHPLWKAVVLSHLIKLFNKTWYLVKSITNITLISPSAQYLATVFKFLSLEDIIAAIDPWPTTKNIRSSIPYIIIKN